MKKCIAEICAALLFCLLLSGCSLRGVAGVLADPDGGAKHTGEKLTDYSVGDAEITERVKNLDVQWASGKVNVVYHNGDGILLSEETGTELPDAQRMHWKLDGDTLRVRFSGGGAISLPGRATKILTVSLPEDFRGEHISLSAASADIITDMLRADRLEADTASGDISLGAENASAVQLDTASGKIDLHQMGAAQYVTLQSASGAIKAELGSVEKLDIETASGNVAVSADALADVETDSASGKVSLTVREYIAECSIDTASGEVTLTLPETLGFTAEVDTASGDFESEIAVKHKGDSYIAGDGAAEIEVETSSGNISILAL